jgi:hypothetical protein
MQTILSARRVRRHRIPVVLAALAIALTGCTTTMSGSAGPGRIDEKLGLPGNRGIVLRQQLGTGAPHSFGGVPAYDACTVMSLDVVQQSGYEVNSTPSRGPVLRTTRMTEDAPDDPNAAATPRPTVSANVCTQARTASCWCSRSIKHRSTPRNSRTRWSVPCDVKVAWTGRWRVFAH